MPILFPIQFDPFRSPDEVVQDTANDVEANDDNEPDDFVVTLGRFLREHFDECPQPKDKNGEDYRGEKQKAEYGNHDGSII